jgi:zinc protease
MRWHGGTLEPAFRHSRAKPLHKTTREIPTLLRCDFALPSSCPWPHDASVRKSPLRLRHCSLVMLALLVASPHRDALAKGAFSVLQLENGVRAILSPDHRFPEVAVVVRYYAGIRHESSGKFGVAHLLEHVTFRPPRPESIFYTVNVSAFASHGSNASTHPGYTQYYHLEPSYRLQTALWDERWRWTAMPMRWSQSDMEWERPIVRNEGRFRGETQAHFQSELKLWQALFPSGHPFHDFIDAAGHDLDAITFNDVKSFFDTWYKPNNTWISVVGDFQPAWAEKLVRDYFGTVPPSLAPTPPALPDASIKQEIVLKNQDPLALSPRLSMAWHSPARFKEGDAEAKVLAQILGEMASGRLHADGAKAASVSVNQIEMGPGSVFMLHAVPLPGVSLDELRQDIDGRLRGMLAVPPTVRELERAVRALVASTFDSMEASLSRANLLIDVVANVGDVDPVSLERGRFAAVTAESAQKFVSLYLKPEQRVVIYSEPTSGHAKQGGK